MHIESEQFLKINTVFDDALLLPFDWIEGVIGDAKIHQAPDMPSPYFGVARWRGGLINIISLEKKELGCFLKKVCVVVNGKTGSVGLLVSKLPEIVKEEDGVFFSSLEEFIDYATQSERNKGES